MNRKFYKKKKEIFLKQIVFALLSPQPKKYGLPSQILITMLCTIWLGVHKYLNIVVAFVLSG